MIDLKPDDVAYYKALIEKNWAAVQKSSPATAESRTAWSRYHHALQAAFNAGALRFADDAPLTSEARQP